MKIVVADDSVLARTFIIKCIEMAGLVDAEFVQAENGAVAFEKLQESKAEMLVTDLNMPQVSGDELVKQVTESPELSHVKVVVVSSAGDPVRLNALIDAGAAAVLPKPVSPAVMAECLEQLEIL